MPLSVPSIVQCRTSMLWTPAVVSEPMEMPWPCLMVLFSMRMFVPPDLITMSSSPVSMSQSWIQKPCRGRVDGVVSAVGTARGLSRVRW